MPRRRRQDPRPRARPRLRFSRAGRQTILFSFLGTVAVGTLAVLLFGRPLARSMSGLFTSPTPAVVSTGTAAPAGPTSAS